MDVFVFVDMDVDMDVDISDVWDIFVMLGWICCYRYRYRDSFKYIMDS